MSAGNTIDDHAQMPTAIQARDKKRLFTDAYPEYAYSSRKRSRVSGSAEETSKPHPTHEILS